MPKSSRNKVVSLTQTEKKTRENKERIADLIRAAMDEYKFVWVLDVENMRNTFLKQIRQDWEGSRILFGRTKLMQKVIGRSPEDEYMENSHELSKVVTGDVGLLFTNEEPQVVKDYFESFVKSDFARSGLISPLTFVVPEGIVYSTGGQQNPEDDVPLAHSLESTLRQLGMPTRLVNGKVTLSAPHTVCEKGQVLDSKQTRILKQFGVACSQFKVHLRGYYSKDEAKVVLNDE